LLLARALKDEPIVAVYSSDLGRATSTASLVAELHKIDVTTDERLRELNTGQWTGKNREQIDKGFPGARKLWSEKPSAMRMPGGETILEAQTRALEFFTTRMPEHQGETVVVISHGGIGQAVLINALGGTVEDLWLKERVDNTQISRLEWTHEHGLQVIELSDVRHLEDVGSLRNWRTTDAA
jgi:broad specificity phosphatase PhoE